jgi:predicted protein tyrosine phosphatase
MEMADLTGLPTNKTRDILRTADLMSVTKKRFKMELKRKFEANLDGKRAHISRGM